MDRFSVDSMRMVMELVDRAENTMFFVLRNNLCAPYLNVYSLELVEMKEVAVMMGYKYPKMFQQRPSAGK